MPRTVTSNHRFQMRTGAGNHEIPSDWESAITAGRALRVWHFPGNDDRAGINRFRRNARRLILGEDQCFQFGLFQPALLINGVKNTGLCQLISRLMNS